MKFASNYFCECGKKAVVFIGLNDPDGTQTPNCRECADEFWIRVMIGFEKFEEREIKRKPKKKFVIKKNII